jgi:hypothetical protein
MKTVINTTAVAEAFALRFQTESTASAVNQLPVTLPGAIAAYFSDIELPPGKVVAGLCADGHRFMLVMSKIGYFLMTENADGTIHYLCPEYFYTSASLKGMFKARGTMDTLEMLERIFAIPDSYK